MRCIYDRTLYFNETNGYVVIVYKTEDTSVPSDARRGKGDKVLRFTAVGYSLPVDNAIEVELTGTWESNPKFGLQLKVEQFEEIMPCSTDGIAKYLSSGCITGIGQKLAKSIVNMFGTGTWDVLDNRSHELLKIKGISQAKLEKIMKSYNESRQIRDIVAFLSPYEISIRQATEIQYMFQGDSMRILRDDPFRLCALKGFDFLTVDKIAKAAGGDPCDPLRIQGAIQYVLEVAERRGHLFLNQKVLRGQAYGLLNEKGAVESVSAVDVYLKLRDMINNGMLINDNQNIYKPAYATAESETAEFIAARLFAKSRFQEDLTAMVDESQKRLGLILSSTQHKAVMMCFKNNLSIITGGPGTGKTTILRVVCDVYKNISKDGKLLLAAPTGRASRRMTESTGCPALTLHKALGLISDDENDYMNDTCILSHDFIIVDESSMIDMKLAYTLLSRVEPDAHILFVGDKDQLPSVGAGNVFRELLNSGLIPTTYLDTVYRQAGTSPIPYNAQYINENKTDLLYGADFDFLDADDEAEAVQIIKDRYVKEVSASGLDEVQILSPRRDKGDASAKLLGDAVRELINPKRSNMPEIKIGARTFRAGDKVMQNKNRDEISNGDVGFVIGVFDDEEDGKGIEVMFTENRHVRYLANDVNLLQFAYALTVHKSQGSEYSTVIVPVLSIFEGALLKRNIYYTAITRAKKRVLLVGQKSALFTAIHTCDADKRNTLLSERIVKNCSRIFKAAQSTVKPCEQICMAEIERSRAV